MLPSMSVSEKHVTYYFYLVIQAWHLGVMVLNDLDVHLIPYNIGKQNCFVYFTAKPVK